MKKIEKIFSGIDKLMEIILGLIAISLGIAATVACIQFIYYFTSMQEFLDANGRVQLIVGTCATLVIGASAILVYMQHRENQKQYKKLQEQEREYNRKIDEYLKELEKMNPENKKQ